LSTLYWANLPNLSAAFVPPQLSAQSRIIKRKTPLIWRETKAVNIVVLEGDRTGQELLEKSLRLLDTSVTGLECDFIKFDRGKT
jgi:hypothetical protein